ncbi:hypothetical protein BDV97DRAFT_403395 [Delphinella strobiligena]|nr:hypothetical protein BDV97DRAFT_403395 [Delphinella strobiligena]
MSSRLLNMKFMQRAAAASPSNPASPATPSSDRPSKRQRLSTGSAASPVTPNPPTPVDPDEVRRQQAIDRAAADAGETKWVLSIQHQQPHTVQTPMRIVTAGYGTIDSAAIASSLKHAAQDDLSEDEGVQARPGIHGRRSFGKFNKTIERQQNPDLSSDSESEDDKDSDQDSDESEDEDEDDDDPASQMIKQQRKEAAEKLRKERKAKRKSDQAQLELLAKERRKKEIKLNRKSGDGISSGGISSGGRGQQSPAGRRGLSEMACHKCGQKGHLIKECPQAQSKSQAPSRDRPWKRRSDLDYD